jgi:hypothetical protein
MDGMHPAEPNSPRAACVGRDGGLAINTGGRSNIWQGQLVTTHATVADVGSCVDLTAIIEHAVAVCVPEGWEHRTQVDEELLKQGNCHQIGRFMMTPFLDSAICMQTWLL